MEKDNATAMNAGELGGGAERVSCRAFEERTERSYEGERDVVVQLILAAFSDREQEPRAPKKILGPSTLVALS